MSTLRMKIIFLGQKPLGEQCFNLLRSNSNFEIVAAVSNQQTEKTWWKTNDIYNQCMRHNIPFIDNSKRNEEDMLQAITMLKPDFLLSVQHPWILSSMLLSQIQYQALNLHMAKLPNYKGWNGFSHAILNNDSHYGTTMHWISDDLDHGDYAYEKSLPIYENDTAYSLYDRCTKLSVDLFNDMLQDLVNDSVPRYKQAVGGQLYTKNSLDEYRYIPIDKLSVANNNIIRALYFPPYPPPYTIMQGQKIALIPLENI